MKRRQITVGALALSAVLGGIAMPAQAQLSDDDARKLAVWVLGGAK